MRNDRAGPSPASPLSSHQYPQAAATWLPDPPDVIPIVCTCLETRICDPVAFFMASNVRSSSDFRTGAACCPRMKAASIQSVEPEGYRTDASA